MSHNYILQVTAGPEYDSKTHKVVKVNTAEPMKISSEHIDLELNVRIQNYRGLPKASPESSPYFDMAPHDYNKDQYSIAFKFTPKYDMNAQDLVFGNDFEDPIRDRLPPGFGTAFKIVKWAIDPGLDGDVYADKPYLYGPLASSINTLKIGSKADPKADAAERSDMGKDGEGMVFEEGGEGGGEALRDEKGVPASEAARKKYFLNEEHRKDFTFQADREHWADFFNPYLDFNAFALKLPGFTLQIMKYWDGQGLRYVLKNRKTDTVYLVIIFTLYLKDDIDDDGNVKAGVKGGKPLDLTDKEFDEKHDDVPDVGALKVDDGTSANDVD